MPTNPMQLELAAYDEKIALSKLEEAKAVERTRELEYERSRYVMQMLVLAAQAEDRANQPKTDTHT